MEYLSSQKLDDIKGKRIFVRVDFNVPVKDGVVINDFRIRSTIPTINLLKEKGAKIILGSHRGGNEGVDLKPISDCLKRMLKHTYLSSPDMLLINEHVSHMENGEVLLLPNLRIWPGEEMSDRHFAESLSLIADVYINEAFSASHRKSSSIVLLPEYLPSFAGLLFENEINNLSKVFNSPTPFLFILGGAKFGTKEPLIDKFVEKADQIFIGGALANDFFINKGYEVGISLLSKPKVEISEIILNNKKIILPSDVEVLMSNGDRLIKKTTEVKRDEKIIDVGPESIRLLRECAEKAKLILWNGPLGIYEDRLSKQTEELALIVAESEAISIVGGGDTVASISRLQLENSFTFLSTAGGAMLEFLLKETLPGIEALQKTPA